MKVIFFGDIVGSIGRKGLKLAVDEVKQKIKPDLMIANIENLAHGKGVTEKTFQEVNSLGIDVFTSGNHIFRKPDYKKLLPAKKNFLRPANFTGDVPGHGWYVVEAGNIKVGVGNLQGRVFMNMLVDDPFRKADEIVDQMKEQGAEIIIIDFHAEATSEKQAFGWYMDGKVSAVIGTHTHIQTNDARVLPCGTAYITDVGFCGAQDSVLGVKKEGPLNMFISSLPGRFDIPESGLVLINSVYLNINKSGKATSIKPVNYRFSI